MCANELLTTIWPLRASTNFLQRLGDVLDRLALTKQEFRPLLRAGGQNEFANDTSRGPNSFRSRSRQIKKPE